MSFFKRHDPGPTPASGRPPGRGPRVTAAILLALMAASCGGKHTSPVSRDTGSWRLLRDSYPAWFPDGGRIAYVHTNMGDTGDTSVTGVYVLTLATNRTRLLVAGYAYSPCWNPSSESLAVSAPALGIVAIDATSGGWAVVVPRSAFFPSWSPSGYLVAYDTQEGDPHGSSAIWLRDRRDGTDRDISVHGQGEWREPRWSPDGSSIAHYRYPGVPAEIFTMDSAGTGAQRLTNDNIQDEDPAWSPDGKLLAWTRNATGPPEVWLMNVDGSAKHELAAGREPSFSPRGDSLVFGNPYSSGVSDLEIISVTGTGGRILAPVVDAHEAPRTRSAQLSLGGEARERIRR